MKKLLLLCFTIIPVLAFSQKAKIEFEKTSHNFGKISETGGNAVYDFVFKNTGTVPLILTNVLGRTQLHGRFAESKRHYGTQTRDSTVFGVGVLRAAGA